MPYDGMDKNFTVKSTINMFWCLVCFLLCLYDGMDMHFTVQLTMTVFMCPARMLSHLF
jgi:hypothetical protein